MLNKQQYLKFFLGKNAIRGVLIWMVTIHTFGCDTDSKWYPEDSSIQYDSLFAKADPESELISEVRIVDGVKEYRDASYFSNGNLSCVFPRQWDTTRISNTRVIVVLMNSGMGYCLSQEGDTLAKQIYTNRKADGLSVTDGVISRVGFLLYPSIEFSMIWDRFFSIQKESYFDMYDPSMGSDSAYNLVTKPRSNYVISSVSNDTILEMKFDQFGCLDSVSIESLNPFFYHDHSRSHLGLDTVFFSLPTSPSVRLSLYAIDEDSISFLSPKDFPHTRNYYYIEFQNREAQPELRIGIRIEDSCDPQSIYNDTISIPLK